MACIMHAFYMHIAKAIDVALLSRNGSPALCTSSFETLPHLDPEGIQPKLMAHPKSTPHLTYIIIMQNLSF